MANQTVSQFLNDPLPVQVPISSVHPIMAAPPRAVTGTPYPQQQVLPLAQWSRLVSTPFQSLFNRSRNSQT